MKLEKVLAHLIENISVHLALLYVNVGYASSLELIASSILERYIKKKSAIILSVWASCLIEHLIVSGVFSANCLINDPSLDKH